MKREKACVRKTDRERWNERERERERERRDMEVAEMLR